MAPSSPFELNDILNFSLPPRPSRIQGNARRSRRAWNAQSAWDKEKYVNAQYRFVVKPTGDYTAHFADPDIYFAWNDILQVIIPRTSAYDSVNGLNSQDRDNDQHKCPICLSVAIAPRMTKCGHIFCFPCLLHYLSTSELKWTRCPLCFDSITESQLKSVKWFDESARYTHYDHFDLSHAPDPRVPTLDMRLMLRPQLTTLALPRSSSWPSDILPPLRTAYHFLPDVYQFAKFMLATPDYLRKDFKDDILRLDGEKLLLQQMQDSLGASFVEAAKDKILLDIEATQEWDSPGIKKEIAGLSRQMSASRSALSTARTKEQYYLDETGPVVTDSAAHEESAKELCGSDSNTVSAPRSQRGHRRNVNPPPPSTSNYYFYQASNGSLIFLHPLDIRILLSHFGAYSSFPSEITLEIEAYNEGSVDDDLRKRCKYLAHLPQSTEVVFVEANLEKVVTQDTLKQFENALRTRRSKRQEKARKEERARIRAEDREREKERESGIWRDVDHLTLNSSSITPTNEAFGQQPTEAEQISAGAWGERSFASALNSSASPVSRPIEPPRQDDILEIDIAFRDLEQQTAGVGKRKRRQNKLVVLGGGGGRARR